MKKSILIIIVFAIFSPLVHAQDGHKNLPDSMLCSDTLKISADQIPADSNYRFIVNNAFGVGEKLTFTIGWKMVKVGEASMEVADVGDHEGRPVYRIKSLAKSFPFFDSFFKVRDTAESWIDVEGLFTWYFRKILNEGSYNNTQVQHYDQCRGIVRAGDTAFLAPKYVQDVLSSLYYIRTQDLKPGESIFIYNFEKDKCYPLEVKIHDREIIDVPAGKFKCIKVEPLLKDAGVFKHEGTLTVWLTDDRLKMPVLMRSKVVVGSIYAELTDYKIGELFEW